MKTTINKVIRVGTTQGYSDRAMSIYCKIKFNDGKLSITGVEGPLKSGNARGGCGQITLNPSEINPAPLWNKRSIAKLQAIWDEWHLNHMTAGSPRQEQYLKDNPIKPSSRSYQVVCEILNQAGLNPDHDYIHKGQPYEYGSDWICREVPQDVIAWLGQLPDTDKTPAWV